ncbi:hypothetical protein [Methylobacterium nigriterrae]|uniref:hypothetical protein n=1 Tax=Methylobacterium nigriterrae TaxID=3127512 RepID=UPI003013C660
MKPTVPPCPGLTSNVWGKVHEAALDFLDRFGSEAMAHGWTAPELFGVHPKLGTTRGDCCGALVLSGSKATAVAADRIGLGLVTYYRNVPGAGTGIPVWEFRW